MGGGDVAAAAAHHRQRLDAATFDIACNFILVTASSAIRYAPSFMAARLIFPIDSAEKFIYLGIIINP